MKKQIEVEVAEVKMVTTSKNISKDLELVAIIKEGTNKREADKSFAKLFNKYSNGMEFAMNSRVTDPDELKDLIMTAFERAYIKIDNFNETKGAFSTWLYGIFNNAVIDHFRKRKEFNNSYLSELMGIDTDGHESERTIPYVELDVSEKMILAERNLAVRQAVAMLKSKFHRQLIESVYFDGMSYQDIAEEMDKPLGTIKANINRAKAILKTMMAGSTLFL